MSDACTTFKGGCRTSDIRLTSGAGETKQDAEAVTAMQASEWDKWADGARVWVFPLRTELTGSSDEILRESLDRFVGGWTAHKAPVNGGYFVYRGRFVIIVADTTGAETSGCSIDTMNREVESALASAGVELAAADEIAFVREGRVVMVSRDEFRELARNGEVTEETVVFDPTVTLLAAFKERKFEVRAADSWHRKLLR